MKTVLRLRWIVYLPSGLFIAVVAAGAALVSPGSLSDLLRFLAFVGAFVALNVAQRRVTVTDEGLWVRRAYLDRFFCAWSEVVAVERRQVGPFAVDQLRLHEPIRRYRRSKTARPPEFTSWPVRSKNVFIGMYDKNWRTGPIGRAMTANGVSLEAPTPGGVS